MNSYILPNPAEATSQHAAWLSFAYEKDGMQW